MKSTPLCGKSSLWRWLRSPAFPCPYRRVEPVSNKPVILLRRFDREGPQRIPFLSAMSMLGAKDRDTRSYLEIVDALRQHGAAPREDMEELWRRIVFNILISNTDDHLHNHGFLYAGLAGGCRLLTT
jgi:serine/threonine-protein kinase HipA